HPIIADRSPQRATAGPRWSGLAGLSLKVPNRPAVQQARLKIEAGLLSRGLHPHPEVRAVGQTILLPTPVAPVGALLAAVSDVWMFKVHNVLTVPLLLSGLVYHGVVGGGGALTSSAFGVLFGFGVLFAFYLMGGMGGGDVKLMAALGAWLGMPLIVYVFLVSALAAGLYALLI